MRFSYAESIVDPTFYAPLARGDERGKSDVTPDDGH
jgi:hypothetical protein